MGEISEEAFLATVATEGIGCALDGYYSADTLEADMQDGELKRLAVAAARATYALVTAIEADPRFEPC